MPKRPYLVGQRFGKLIVIKLSDKKNNRNIKMWECKCDCGATCYATTNSLKTNNTRSCGCLQKEIASQLKSIDLTGQQFGMLTVIELDDTRITKGNKHWKCKCSCGRFSSPTTHALLSGNTKSCGCQQKKPIKDLTGQRFGHWTVIELDRNKNNFIYWICQCDCGNIKSVRGNNLKSGDSTNCGCLKSKGEVFVNDWLKENNFIFQREYSYPDLKGDKAPLRFDFYVNGKLIEVMGIQHYNKKGWGVSEQLKRYDELKYNYCKKNDIKILYLDYNSNSTIPFKEWEQKLKEFLGGMS